MQKSSRSSIPAIVFIVFLLVAAVSTYALNSLRNSCEVTFVQNASALLLSQMQRYNDIYQVATSASPDSAVLPVTMMQQILMDSKDVDVPACMQTAKDELIDYMGTVIRAFLAYSQREADTTVSDLIAQSDTHYGNFYAELEAVKECAPLCIR